MKRLWAKIKIFFFYLFAGMKNANDVAFTGQKDVEAGDGSGIEQQKEVNSVYKDLLRGELTQEVIELRHEMYFAERASKKYEYAGNGRAKLRNSVIDYTGILEMSDGLPVLLVQDNKEDPGSLMDFDIYNMGEDVELGEKAKGDLSKKSERNFTIQIKRDYSPRFRLEQYAKKIVVKPIDDKRSLIDIYVSSYAEQFNYTSKLFQGEMNKIYQGNTKSDLLEFDALGFITYKAFGVDDFITFTFKNFVFQNIIKFDGSYVLRFEAENDIFNDDMLDEMFDEKTDEKCRNHELRNNNTTLSAEMFLKELNDEKIDTEQVSDLLSELKQ